MPISLASVEEEDLLPPVMPRRLSAAQRARARRMTKIVGGIVALAAVPLLVGLWLYMSSKHRADDELAREDRSVADGREPAAGAEPRGGWPTAVPAAATPSVALAAPEVAPAVDAPSADAPAPSGPNIALAEPESGSAPADPPANDALDPTSAAAVAAKAARPGEPCG